ILRSIIQEHTDCYLDKIVWEMEIQCGKKHNELLRSAFMARIATQYQYEQLIFLDKSAKNKRTITCSYSYSNINTRAIKRIVFVHSKYYTILLALTLDAIIAVDIIEGSYTKEKFKKFVISQIHHHNGLLEYLSAFDVRVEFLPLYSPDLNPIELAFSVIKNYLKRYKYFVENSSDPIYPLLVACSQITPLFANAFFNKAGYK
ncbi:42847_t:CDS:2, partial [Gigaspora margarita]